MIQAWDSRGEDASSALPALGACLGFADDYVIAVRAGDGAVDQKHIFGFAHLDDFEILDGALDLAHVAGHPHAASDGAGEQTLADGAGAAVPAFGAVGRIAPAKRVPADHAFKPAALGHADGVHVIAGGKEIGAQNIAGFDFLAEIAEFADAFDGDPVEFLDVTEQGFGHAVFFLVVKPELNGVVAVTLLSLALEDAIGAGEDDGDGGNDAFGIIDPGLAQFLS